MTAIALIGSGEAARKRVSLIVQSGGADLTVYGCAPEAAAGEMAGARFVEQFPNEDEIAKLGLLFMAGLEDRAAAHFAALARRFGVLVNTEDKKELCDFHIPSVLRRGDLTLTVSTNGASPALARLVREDLSRRFGPEWEERTAEIAGMRVQWRRDGLTASRIAELTRTTLVERGWL